MRNLYECKRQRDSMYAMLLDEILQPLLAFAAQRIRPHTQSLPAHSTGWQALHGLDAIFKCFDYIMLSRKARISFLSQHCGVG